MELEKFKQRVQPNSRRSKLDKFITEIFALRNDGYTLQQIADFLKENGTVVTRQSVQEFIQRRSASGGAIPAPRAAPAALPPTPTATPGAAPATEPDTPPISGDDLEGLDKKQRREKRADQFIKPEAENPLLKRIKKENS